MLTLSDAAETFIMKEKMRSFCRTVFYVQRRIRALVSTKISKVEVLINYWDKLFGQLQMRASKLYDDQTKELCMNIVKIPKSI